MKLSGAVTWIRLGALAAIFAGSLALAPQAGASPAAFCSARGLEACNGSDWQWAVDDAAQYCGECGGVTVSSCNVYYYCEPEVSYEYQCDFC